MISNKRRFGNRGTKPNKSNSNIRDNITVSSRIALKGKRRVRLTPLEAQILGVGGRNALETYLKLKETQPIAAEHYLRQLGFHGK